MSGAPTTIPLVLSLSNDLKAGESVRWRGLKSLVILRSAVGRRRIFQASLWQTLRKPAQRTIAPPVVMSGSGPARPAGRFLSRAGFAPALQVLTWPFLVITVLMLARGWWLAPSCGSWRGPA